MSEKTAEEKLRQALEGSTASTSDNEPPKSKTQTKPRPSRAKPKSPSRTAKSENIGRRLDSFMDDFERRIEQSLNAVKSPSESPDHHEKPGRSKISAEHKPVTSRRLHARTKTNPEPLQEVIHSQPEPEPVAEVETVQEDLPVVESEAPQEISQPEPESVPEIETVKEDSPVVEPESAQEILQPEPEPVPEVEPLQDEIIPDVMPLEEEYEPEPELPDIPVIEAAFDEVPETPQDSYGDLPDIPVINADEEDDTAEIFTDGLEDLMPPADDISGHEEETEEPHEESRIDFQEAELVEAPENEEDFADIDTDIAEDNSDVFSDEPLDEEPASPEYEEEITNADDEDTAEAPTYDIESDEAGIFADDNTDKTPEDFSPSADVFLNVDEEIPQNSAQPEKLSDPEAESAPVTVSMPESTKTAEDKLMADIAEAMTGNPLSLDSQESPGPYNLPENFFTDSANNGDSPQSAEDKLKANIAQALSESPINAAHEQARQSLEEDINPFDELSMPENFTPADDETHDDESSQEETLDAENSHDAEELMPEETHDEEDFAPEETPGNDEELFPNVDEADENSEPQSTDDNKVPNDPFTIPDFRDDDTESEPDFESSEDETRFFTEAFTDDTDETKPESMPEIPFETEGGPAQEISASDESEPQHDFDTAPESEPVTEIETEKEAELIPDIEHEPEQTQEFFTDNESAESDDMPFPVNEPEKTPLTEQEALIAMVNQEFEPEDNKFDTEKQQEEAHSENNMPEQSLLNDETPGTFEPEENDEAFDMSSLGELGQAATFADDSEDFSAAPGTVTEMITQPEAGITHQPITHTPEDEHKEKTMNIREKLSSRKKGNAESASGNSKSGLLLTVLTAALAVIGGLILWQLMTVSDKITSLAMNAPGYEASAGAETPSYDYAIDFILDPNIADRMAQRGRAGWQVVGSRRTQDSTTGQYGYEFIFMRRTPGR